MTRTENTRDTRVVVMDLSFDNETTILGALADSVHEVMDLDHEQVDAPPKIGSRWKTEFIKGIGKKDGEFIIVLDIEKVFSTDELAKVNDAGIQGENLENDKMAA